jgi:DNA ligase D-like protein (predicted polymerase)/DNA ligase D-like protein (predicted 3'-phosphoesterase)
MANLDEYRQRRDAARTPEPVPAEGPLPHGDDDVFVVQEHHARALHYDVRLERNGVLVSWAVPKGLLMPPGAVRLAVHTEDHPMEYATFEGDIPRGEYGGGKVTIWDRGRYDTLKWTDDEVQVEFHGQRVQGRYVFFHKGDSRDWMVRRTGVRATPSVPVEVEVDGRRLGLTDLDKVLYPSTGFTKAEVIDYYRRVAPVMLPHLAGRPVQLRRYPDGVDGQSFYEKNVARHAPDWVRTATTDSVVIDDLPALVWAANLAVLELHVPPRPDLVVFDLDPGAPATIVECCRVAELIRPILDDDGLVGYPKTSGGKGLQLYVPVSEAVRYAKAVARRLAREHPDQVVAVMARARRPGKVFIDWSRNNPAKTTVAPYSLRAREHPTVSTPVTWQEIADCRRPEDLVFTAPDVLTRIEERGDLLADL